MKQYTAPEMEIISFDTADVITVSSVAKPQVPPFNDGGE